MSDHNGRWLWERWMDLWNGDLEALDEIIHPDFVMHRFPPPRIPEHLAGREALQAWINRLGTVFSDLHFEVEVGPVVDGEAVAGRWVAEGTYQGGTPGSTAPPGTRVRFHGNDIWRSDGGKIREYWLSDDSLDLMQQLGVIPTGKG